MGFHVGQKVVCIDASKRNQNNQWRGDIPVKDAIYTIAGFYHADHLPGLILVEIKNFPFGGSYDALRFRPVQERKTDIGIFTAMLNTKQKEIVE